LLRLLRQKLQMRRIFVEIITSKTTDGASLLRILCQKIQFRRNLNEIRVKCKSRKSLIQILPLHFTRKSQQQQLTYMPCIFQLCRANWTTYPLSPQFAATPPHRKNRPNSPEFTRNVRIVRFLPISGEELCIWSN
jgi:hypothetical protein